MEGRQRRVVATDARAWTDGTVWTMSSFTVFATPGEHLDRGALAMAEWRRWADGPVERIDASDTVALRAFLGGGLFGGTRYCEVERIERLEVDEHWRATRDVHVAGVFVWSRRSDRSRLARLEGCFDVVWCDDRWAAAEVAATFRRRGLTLEPAAERLLVERCADDLVRACSIAQGAQMAGFDRLSVGHCTALLGSQWPSGAVFDIVDALLDGRYDTAVTASASVDVLVLARHLVDAVSIVVAGRAAATPAALASACGVHPFVAKKRIAAARRFDEAALFDALCEATDGWLRARRGQVRSDELVARVAGALAGGFGGVDSRS